MATNFLQKTDEKKCIKSGHVLFENEHFRSLVVCKPLLIKDRETGTLFWYYVQISHVKKRPVTKAMCGSFNSKDKN